MNTPPSDRIRRILSDGLPPAVDTKRRGPVLREVAGETARPDGAPAQAVPPHPVPDGLRERLALLDRLSSRNANLAPLRGAAVPAPEAAAGPLARPEPAVRLPLAPPAEPLDAPPAASGATRLEDLLGGTLRTTARGSCWQVDRVYALAAHHGREALGPAADARLPLRPGERAPAGLDSLAVRDAIFFDTETTGLAGGTGTVAFLVGLGWVEGDTFRLRQLLMRDYPEEPALLEAVREDIGDRPLVSFNGRSYDWPLLATRWRLNRTAWRAAHAAPHDPPPRAHLDLLVAARRLWARTLHSRSLGSLERHVLGLDRGEDLAGARIPAAWFHFLRTGWGVDVARACQHNAVDIVSLLALFGRVEAAFRAPEAPAAHPGDALGTARWLVELGATDRARRCLEAGLAQTAVAEARGEASSADRLHLQRELGTLLRRLDDPEGALEHWRAVARGLPTFDRHAYEQVAKILEHRLGRPAEALAWTQEAQGRVAPGSRGAEALTHRANRLRRKVDG
jgi:uncharacterized protein YprB with RNaseH-like and TPR domain